MEEMKDKVPIMDVIKTNDKSKIKEAVKKNKKYINSEKSEEGYFPLYIAALHGNMDALKILLKNGADLNKEDNDGITPLYVASEFGKIEVVKELCKNIKKYSEMLGDYMMEKAEDSVE